MADETSFQTMEIQCQEERRTARLLVEWRHQHGRRTVVGIQCDNPRFYDLEPWQCHWSCWEAVERAGSREDESAEGRG